MRGQRGVSLTGFLLWAVLLIGVALLGFKVGPAYFEALAIEKQFKAMAADSTLRNAPRREIEGRFLARAQIENIRSITEKDVEVSKDGDRLTVSASYSVKVPLFGNASACLDFNPSSAN